MDSDTKQTSETPQEPASQKDPEVVIPGPAAVIPETSEDSKAKRKLTILTAIILAIALLVGAGVVAYYTLIVANEPENVLKRAVANSLKTPPSQIEANFAFETADGPDFQVAVKGQGDASGENGQFELEFRIDELTIPVEARVIGQDMYLKVDNLKKLLKFDEISSSPFAGMIAQGAKALDGQWIVLEGDEADPLGASCYQDIEFKFNDADLKLLSRRYDQVPFATISQISDDEVDGRAATKYDLQIDGNKAGEYAQELEELSFIQELKECDPTFEELFEQESDSDYSGEDSGGPLTLWVDKESNRIVRLASQSTDEDSNNDTSNLDIKFAYGTTVEVTRPEGAKPFSEIMTQILPQLDDLEGLPTGEGADEI